MRGGTPARYTRPRGVCPVCGESKPLLSSSGKVGSHGRSPELPMGCPGSYQRPVRLGGDGKPVAGGVTVVGRRAQDAGATAQGGPVQSEQEEDDSCS